MVEAIGGTNTCSDKGSYGVTLSKTGANEDVSIWKTFTGVDRIYVNTMMRPISGFDDTLIQIAAAFDNTTNWNMIAGLHLKLVSGSYYIGYNNGSNYGNITDCGSTPITAGSWVKIGMDIVRNGTSTIYLNGSSACTFTASNYSIGVFSIGSYYAASNYSIQWDTIKVDDDALPSICP